MLAQYKLNVFFGRVVPQTFLFEIHHCVVCSEHLYKQSIFDEIFDEILALL